MERFKVRIASCYELYETVKRGDLYSLAKSPYTAGIFDDMIIKCALKQYNMGHVDAYKWLEHQSISLGTDDAALFREESWVYICKYGTVEMIESSVRNFLNNMD